MAREVALEIAVQDTDGVRVAAEVGAQRVTDTRSIPIYLTRAALVDKGDLLRFMTVLSHLGCGADLKIIGSRGDVDQAAVSALDGGEAVLVTPRVSLGLSTERTRHLDNRHLSNHLCYPKCRRGG